MPKLVERLSKRDRKNIKKPLRKLDRKPARPSTPPLDPSDLIKNKDTIQQEAN